MRPSALAVAASLAFLAGCSREEEPVADRFERARAEIENKARAYEAQVENEVGAAEARLDNEADALLANQLVQNEAADEAAPANRSR
ncbi:MAG TPA: hypothetical protein VN231_02270 [Allosphingosinicella sp.]|nr:hypothetical protein [Allosphingosinicella sp.]